MESDDETMRNLSTILQIIKTNLQKAHLDLSTDQTDEYKIAVSKLLVLEIQAPLI